MSQAKFSVVLVTWEDSAQAVPGWRWLEEMAPPQIVTCYTVGFVVQETERALDIAVSVGGKGEIDQASGVVSIPKSAVLERKVIATLPAGGAGNAKEEERS